MGVDDGGEDLGVSFDGASGGGMRSDVNDEFAEFVDVGFHGAEAFFILLSSFHRDAPSNRNPEIQYEKKRWSLSICYWAVTPNIKEIIVKRQ